jgi:hypothetical protein
VGPTRQGLALLVLGLWLGLGEGSGWGPADTGAWAASTGPSLSIPELTAQADVIVVGQVVAVRSGWDAAGRMITTVAEVRPEEVLKGRSSTALLRVRHLGGRVGDRAAVLADAPAFVDGERVLLFLAARPGGELGVVGLSQGKFTVLQDAAGRSVVRRAGPGAREEFLLDDARDLIRRAAGG